MRQARQRTQNKPIIPIRRVRESTSILLLAFACFLLIALLSFHHVDPGWSHVGHTQTIQNLAGKTGALLSDILLSLMGYLAYALPFAFGTIAFKIYKESPLETSMPSSHWWILRAIGLSMTLTSGCGLAALYHPASRLPMGAGGALGGMIHDFLLPSLNYLGTLVILSGILLAGLTLFAGLSWVVIIDVIGRWALRVLQHTYTGLLAFAAEAKKKWLLMPSKEDLQAEPLEKPASLESIRMPQPSKPAILKPITTSPTVSKNLMPVPAPKMMQKVQQEPLFKATQADKSGAPSLSLLEAVTASDQQIGFSELELQALSELVEKRLQEFGVEVKVVLVSPGPVITRFELDLAAGVKVSKIVGLAKDLARALSVTSVRVVEIIPGKSTVGLEIPNQERETVRLKEILEDQTYQQARSPITLGLGKDISGQVVVADLSKMPHLLVAGTTGSGKSVGLNAMLLSILYKATPEDVRLIMIDPKMLELAVYDNIPHLLTPVVTDMKEAANSLRWCVGEMERRYQLMAALGVRNLVGYNKKVDDAKKAGNPLTDPLWLEASGEPPSALEKLPYIVVVIDEFADMMMVVGKKVEELIARIAQKARAAGIHLILATQRPSVDVITGLIKANIPTRIAYQVSSRIDSRTILDQSGAEQLLGHGDMLYLPPGVGIPIRVHGAFVADDEVHKVVHELRSHGKPEYIESITRTSSVPSLLDPSADEDGESDELYDQAVAIVIESRKTSISYIQRRLKIGYNRAARLVEQMEFSGVVSPVQSNGAREILVPSQSENI